MLAARPLDPFFGPVPFLIAVICVLGTVVGGVWVACGWLWTTAREQTTQPWIWGLRAE